MVRVNLLKNLQANNKLPSHVKPLDLLADKVKVPAEETTYWCRVFKLPNEFLKQKHHIYQVKIISRLFEQLLDYYCSMKQIYKAPVKG